MHRSPRARGQEAAAVAGKQPPGAAGMHLKAKGCSEGKGSSGHRSPRVEDRRSPRSPQQEKKLSTRVADLETKLGRAQGELKKLKQQLASAEVAKHDALSELGETKKSVLAEDSPLPISNTSCREVSEVQVTPLAVPIEETKTKNVQMATIETLQVTELRAELVEKSRELQSTVEDNGSLRMRAEEAQVNVEKLHAELHRAEKELQESKAEVETLKLELETAEKAKWALESDMRRLRVQTDQWRKAAETAAAVLTTGGDMCSYGSLMAPEDCGFGGGKRKSSAGAGAGGRIFGDLWKKKD